jgi:hypothetical protein
MSNKHILYTVIVFALTFSSTKTSANDAESKEEISSTLKNMWQGWSIILEGGLHFKTLPLEDHGDLPFGHKEKFWGEAGILGSVGLKYARTFFTHGYWDIRALWTAFYPDVRWKGDQARITLSSIPVVGKYIGFGSAPGYLSMLMPILYFDIGYITTKGYIFSLGSVYIWGLSPAFAIPFDDHWSMEFRTTVFLDRLFFDQGYHNLLTGLAVNYKF